MESRESEAKSEDDKKRQIKRFCRNCGHEVTGEAAAEFAYQRKCPNCGSISVLMTQKTYDGYVLSQKEKKEFEAEQRTRAEAVHASLSSLPMLAQDADTSPYFEALSYGIVIPSNVPYEWVKDTLKKVKEAGGKRNPFVDTEKCSEALEQRRPVSSRQEGFLKRLHASSDQPLTVRSATALINRLIGDDVTIYYDEDEKGPSTTPRFPCPYCDQLIPADETICRHCNSPLDEWVLEASLNKNDDISIVSKVHGNRQVMCATRAESARKDKSDDSPKKEPTTKEAIAGCGCFILFAFGVAVLLWWFFW